MISPASETHGPPDNRASNSPAEFPGQTQEKTKLPQRLLPFEICDYAETVIEHDQKQEILRSQGKRGVELKTSPGNEKADRWKTL